MTSTALPWPERFDIRRIKSKTDALPTSPAAVGSLMGLANDAITAAKFDETTAFPLAAADSGSTAVARTGADSDTLETLSDQLDAKAATGNDGDTLETLSDQLDFLNNADAGGLAATAGSLSYDVGELERHFHGWESWFCAAASPNAEIHVADRIGNTGTTAFTLTAGNNTWGAWLQLLGSSDTPARTSQVKYDFHKILVTTTNQAGVWFLQFAFGASGADALTAGTYTEMVYNPASPTDKTEELPIMSRRQAAGTKAWARAWGVGSSGKTIALMFGLHEYEG